MLKLEKNKGCKLRFVIFGHFRFPSQNNICEKLVLSSSKNPQKWFYVHLGRLMHINHRNYAQLSRNEVILGSTYFIALWKLSESISFLIICLQHASHIFLTLIWKQLAYANFALSNLYLHDQCLFILCYAFMY